MKESEQRKKEDMELKLEPKPKLELNRWIVNDKFDNWIIYLNGDTGFYGAHDNSEWVFNNDTTLRNIITIQRYNDDSSYRYATDEEMLDRLSKVAIKKGYKERQSECLSVCRNRKIDFSICMFDLNNSKELVIFDSHHANVIFSNGKWADFIETDSEKIERLEKEVKELKNKIK